MVKFGWTVPILPYIPFLVSAGSSYVFSRHSRRFRRPAYRCCAYRWLRGDEDSFLPFSGQILNLRYNRCHTCIMSSWNEVLWPLIVIRKKTDGPCLRWLPCLPVGGRAEAQLGVSLPLPCFLAAPIIIAYRFLPEYYYTEYGFSGLKD